MRRKQMTKVVKVAKKTSRGYVTYHISLPKALIETLGKPRKMAVNLEIRNNKPYIVLEPLEPEQQEVK